MRNNNNNHRSGGFSLIELLVVIAIIGIIAAVAIPSYNGYMLKSRRVDGVSFLSEVASEQVRFYSEYNRYANDMSELGYGGATADSSEGYYNMSVVTANAASSYVLTATPVAGRAQASDTDCGAMSITSSGVKTISGTSTPEDCW